MEARQFEGEQVRQVSEVQVPIEAEVVDADMSVKSESENKKVLESVRKRLKEIEEESINLRAKFELVESGQEAEDLTAAAAATLAEKEEVDCRSIFVGNVDYECTPEEVQQHFQSCGTVNRVTIMSDAFGNPKGFAYVEFVDTEAVQNALLLNETELHGRQLKVSPKRTNLPGMRQYRGRRFLGRSFMPGPPFFPSYGYWRAPRHRSFMRYNPY